MTAAGPEEYSSSPIVLGIAGAIIVGALGGWVLLSSKGLAPPVDQADTSTTLAIALPRIPGEVFSAAAETDAVPVAEAPVDVAVELRKARLAADADLLVSPPRQNALYFYARVLTAEPDNPVANAELDAVMAGISILVDDHLTAEEFDEAYDLALSAARHMPDHPLVEAMRADLNDYAAALVTEATLLAEEGNDDEAAATIAKLDGMSGLSAEYIAAANASILDIQQSRLTAEQERLEEERRATELAELAAWQQKIRDAIAAGNLLAPDGESARDYLGERDAEAEIKDPLTAELYTAMLDVARGSLEAGELADTETYLLAAGEISDDDELDTLRVELEQALLERQKSTVASLSEFVRLNATPAEYPGRAQERSISGWVDVEFTVTTTGETSNIDILRAEPANFFERSAVEAVGQWTFEPRQFRGQPIEQRTMARLVFNLE
ncbi:MAG: energy transducer TonB [Gammaproteobacteria bacterium]|nr:energy transducer TonB [Gammaproteobacteria bacterium]